MIEERNYSVYKHTSPSNKVYIGITSQKVEKRWQNGEHYKTQIFYRAIQKYGWSNFKHEILFTNLTKEEACQKEIELIAFYKSNQREFGYNLSKGGESGMSGFVHSEEAKRKMSEAHRGKEVWNKGKINIYSEDTINKIKAARKKQVFSEESYKKLSEHHKKVALSYKEYKLNGGTLTWNEFQKEYKNIG